jgi:hypothetical protein
MPATKNTKNASAKKETSVPVEQPVEPVAKKGASTPAEAPVKQANPRSAANRQPPNKQKAAPAKKEKAAPAKKEKAAPAKKEPQAEEVAAESSEEERGSGYRYFKILTTRIRPLNGSPEIALDQLSLKGGRFKGRNPMQAAKKAYTKICNVAAKSGYEGDCSYIFTIHETTQKAGKKKEFTYQGERRKLETPEKIVKDGNIYYVKFSSNVKSYKEDSSSEESAPEKKQEKPVSRVKKNVRIETPAESSSASAPQEVVAPVVEQPPPEKNEAVPATKAEPKQAPKGRGRAGGK